MGAWSEDYAILSSGSTISAVVFRPSDMIDTHYLAWLELQELAQRVGVQANDGARHLAWVRKTNLSLCAGPNLCLRHLALAKEHRPGVVIITAATDRHPSRLSET